MRSQQPLPHPDDNGRTLLRVLAGELFVMVFAIVFSTAAIVHNLFMIITVIGSREELFALVWLLPLVRGSKQHICGGYAPGLPGHIRCSLMVSPWSE